jgi:hypothetical protein
MRGVMQGTLPLSIDHSTGIIDIVPYYYNYTMSKSKN